MYFKYFFIFLSINCALAWEDEDFEVFDVVEEVNQNFYELLGVKKDASSSEIKAAYRNLTLKLHPDKSDAPDAEVQFRNLVSVYNILKDPGKREKYDDVLINGLPNWKSAVYYYRRVRKMGLTEMCIILFIIISIGQYVVGWAAYAEKRYFAEQVFGNKIKKMQKKRTGTGDLAEFIAEIPIPSVKDTLPFQIVRLILSIVFHLPHIPKYIIDYIRERKIQQQESARRMKIESERLKREEEEAAKEKELRGLRRRRLGFVPPEKEDDGSCFLDPVDEPEKDIQPKATPAPVVSGGLWTDDDLETLIKLVKKYPVGYAGRWEKIAETMRRNVGEVTHMAAKLKDNCYRLPGQVENTEEIPGLEAPKKVKTKGGKVAAPTNINIESNWTQVQQKALEAALAKYPRGGASDRWDKIAKCVPEKTKEECMLRYKHLVELVKKQKADETEEKNATNQSDEQLDLNSETLSESNQAPS